MLGRIWAACEMVEQIVASVPATDKLSIGDLETVLISASALESFLYARLEMKDEAIQVMSDAMQFITSKKEGGMK